MLEAVRVAEGVAGFEEIGEHVGRGDLVDGFLDLAVGGFDGAGDVWNRARVVAAGEPEGGFVRDAAVVVAEALEERGANARRVVIGETADGERRAIAHGRVVVAHEREHHAFGALIGNEILERGRNGPPDVRRVVLRGARERLDRARILLLPEGVHDAFDDAGVAIGEHRGEDRGRLVGVGVKLPEDVGASDARRRVVALTELRRAVEDLAGPERVELANRNPPRVVVSLPSDDGEQLIDGMHAPMLPYLPAMRSRLILILLTLVLAACGQLETPTDPLGGGEPIDPTATFTRVQNEIFTPTCARLGCHDTIGQQSQLVLTTGRAYAATVNVPSVEIPSLRRVAPGDVANSYLYRKITGAGITGDRMPQALPPLTDAQIALVRNWIRRGAPND